MELSKLSMPDLYRMKNDIDKEIYQRRRASNEREWEEYAKELLLLDESDPGYQNWLSDRTRYSYGLNSLEDYRKHLLYNYKQDQDLVDMGR